MIRTASSTLVHIGLVLLLAATIAARGQDMTILLAGGIVLLALEVVEFKNVSPERGTVAQVILGSTLLLVTVIRTVESIGGQFTAHHFYLMIMLIGLVLILIENMRRYASSEARRIYASNMKHPKAAS